MFSNLLGIKYSQQVSKTRDLWRLTKVAAYENCMSGNQLAAIVGLREIEYQIFAFHGNSTPKKGVHWRDG